MMVLINSTKHVDVQLSTQNDINQDHDYVWKNLDLSNFHLFLLYTEQQGSQNYNFSQKILEENQNIQNINNQELQLTLNHEKNQIINVKNHKKSKKQIKNENIILKFIIFFYQHINLSTLEQYITNQRFISVDFISKLLNGQKFCPLEILYINKTQFVNIDHISKIIINLYKEYHINVNYLYMKTEIKNQIKCKFQTLLEHNWEFFALKKIFLINLLLMFLVYHKIDLNNSTEILRLWKKINILQYNQKKPQYLQILEELFDIKFQNNITFKLLQYIFTKITQNPKYNQIHIYHTPISLDSCQRKILEDLMKEMQLTIKHITR